MASPLATPLQQRFFTGLMLAAVLSFSACDPTEPDAPPPPPDPVAPQATVFDTQLDALERAKAVDQTVQDAKARTDAALEAADAP